MHPVYEILWLILSWFCSDNRSCELLQCRSERNFYDTVPAVAFGVLNPQAEECLSMSKQSKPIPLRTTQTLENYTGFVLSKFLLKVIIPSFKHSNSVIIRFPVRIVIGSTLLRRTCTQIENIAGSRVNRISFCLALFLVFHALRTPWQTRHHTRDSS